MALIKCFLEARRGFHTAFRPPPLTKEDRSRIAKHALLAFNVMIAQKIKPDIFMYTNLIRIMGDAGLEWQAYKFFARMLEQGVTPLPETYAALKLATHPRRTALHNDITRKLEETWKEMPLEIANELDRKEEAQRLTLANDLSKMRQGTLIPSSILRFPEGLSEEKPLPASALFDRVKKDAESGGLINSPDTDRNASYATLKIDNPTLTWETFKTAQEESSRLSNTMNKEEKSKALSALSELHDDELRIFLTIAKQFRHGSREDLLDRIVENVPYNQVMAMISRRIDFFVNMRKQFKELMQEKTPSSDEAGGLRDSSRLMDNANTSEEILQSTTGAGESQAKPNTEVSGKSVRVLYTPWGFIKEPIFKQLPRSMPNPARNIQMSDADIKSIVSAVELNELDKVSPRVLRQFARQEKLKWKRRGGELYDIIKFHVQSVKNSDSSRQHQREPNIDFEKTLQEPDTKKMSPLEMLRAIVRYSAEVKAVDDSEISTSVKRIMEKQRTDRIKHELQKNKEKSRKSIPLLVKYRMKKAGVEPVEFSQGATPVPMSRKSENPWHEETEEEFMEPNTQLHDSTPNGSDSRNSKSQPCYRHQGDSFSESTFGRFKKLRIEHSKASENNLSILESAQSELLAKKQRRPLNKSETRKLSKCRLNMHRLKKSQSRSQYRKENPPLMRKPRVFMAQRM